MELSCSSKVEWVHTKAIWIMINFVIITTGEHLKRKCKKGKKICLEGLLQATQLCVFN